VIETCQDEEALSDYFYSFRDWFDHLLKQPGWKTHLDTARVPDRERAAALATRPSEPLAPTTAAAKSLRIDPRTLRRYLVMIREGQVDRPLAPDITYRWNEQRSVYEF